LLDDGLRDWVAKTLNSCWRISFISLQEAAHELGDAEEEIRVSFDGSGNLVRMGHQLADYQKRGRELDDVPGAVSGRSQTTLECERFNADRGSSGALLLR
jgi:hypothetical protein